jgi:hypothetical protein
MENRAPFFPGFQIDEKFSIEKTRVVGSVIGTAYLTGALRHFGK